MVDVFHCSRCPNAPFYFVKSSPEVTGWDVGLCLTHYVEWADAHRKLASEVLDDIG